MYKTVYLPKPTELNGTKNNERMEKRIVQGNLMYSNKEKIKKLLNPNIDDDCGKRI